jgi:hypothetical protein
VWIGGDEPRDSVLNAFTRRAPGRIGDDLLDCGRRGRRRDVGGRHSGFNDITDPAVPRRQRERPQAVPRYGRTTSPRPPLRTRRRRAAGPSACTTDVRVCGPRLLLISVSMPFPRELRGQRLADGAGADDADRHGDLAGRPPS